jgi:LPXTG-site transpeptidase (sortase) family protein
MHIPYNGKSTGRDIQKFSFSERIWEFIRFCVVTGMIFAVSFFTLNFGAYKQIFSDMLYPDSQAKAQEVLGNATGDSTSVDPSMLLPVLPENNDKKNTFSWVEIPVVPTDNRIVIPKLGKSVPLVEMGTENISGENWNDLEKQIQKGLQQGIVHYPGTAKPGQYGNVFMTGHSSYYPWDPGKFKDVFATLNKLEVGDRYYVYYDQKKYTYQVTDKKDVQPSNVAVLEQPTDKKMATLMTCTPVGTALRRLIITADQIG